ncbi:MAG: FKBP-type peptidyl-prolyl cis-trans isomerase [Kofleriaceae bacterium]
MRVLATLVALSLCACQKSDSQPPPDQKLAVGSGSKFKVEQVPPPVDLKTPPADAVKTPSGLVYKKTQTNAAGTAPKRNDTVLINYTGWKPSTGETFYTNKARGTPMPLNLSTTAPGFTEAMQLLKTGEKAILWVPAAIGYKDVAKGATTETLVYEVEVVEVRPAPVVPADVAAAPANAESTKSGTKFVVVRPGTGSEKAKSWDNVTYNYTAWDDTGRMFETTEMKKRPSKIAPYRQAAALEEVLTSMTAGERVRVWSTGEKMAPNGKVAAGLPTGNVCYEIEVITIEPGVEPPPVPSDVAKPPSDAQKTAKGTFFKVLKAGKGGPKPKATDTVKLNYTGWTTDGRMFDSSVIRKEPAEFNLQSVVAGWTDGVPQMSVGDKYRFWIPNELAYKGAPGRPQGMLVFDIELLEIKAPAPVGDRPPPRHPPVPAQHHP